MTNRERFRLALQAHAAEHEAMREKGLARGLSIGRPKYGHGLAGANALGVVHRTAIHTPDIIQLHASNLQGLDSYYGTGTQYALQLAQQGTWLPTELKELPKLERTHTEITRAGRGIMQRAGFGAITDESWFPWAAAAAGVLAVSLLLWSAT